MDQRSNKFKIEAEVMEALDVMHPEDCFPAINPLFVVEIKGVRHIYGRPLPIRETHEKVFDITYPICVEDAVECVHMIKTYKEEIVKWDLDTTTREDSDLTVWQKYLYEEDMIPKSAREIIEVNMYIDYNGIRVFVVPKP